MGWLVGSALGIRRRHVEAALAQAGLGRVASDVYRSLGSGVFELLWLEGRGAGERELPFQFSPAAAAALRAAHGRGRGVVVATAHTGNWDLNACGAGQWTREQLSAPLTVVTKRLSWASLDRYWQRLRAARGVLLVPAQGAVRAVQVALRSGGVVALLIDQAPERRSQVVSAPFLGRPARHDLGPALLAARAQAPLLVLSGYRDDTGRHHLELLDEIAPAELRGGRGALERATARMAAALERFILEHPTQWLWLHRRWK